MVEKHQKVNRRQRKVQAQAAFVSGLVQPMIVLANALTYIAVNLVGGYLIVKGRLPVGTVVTVILFARQFSAPLEQISEGLSQMQRTTAAARRVFHLLELPEGGSQARTGAAGGGAGSGGVPPCGLLL